MAENTNATEVRLVLRSDKKRLRVEHACHGIDRKELLMLQTLITKSYRDSQSFSSVRSRVRRSVIGKTVYQCLIILRANSTDSFTQARVGCRGEPVAEFTCLVGLFLHRDPNGYGHWPSSSDFDQQLRASMRFSCTGFGRYSHTLSTKIPQRVLRATGPT